MGVEKDENVYFIVNHLLIVGFFPFLRKGNYLKSRYSNQNYFVGIYVMLFLQLKSFVVTKTTTFV